MEKPQFDTLMLAVTGLNTKIDFAVSGLDAKIEKLEAKMDAQYRELRTAIADVKTELIGKLGAEISNHDRRLTKLEGPHA